MKGDQPTPVGPLAMTRFSAHPCFRKSRNLWLADRDAPDVDEIDVAAADAHGAGAAGASLFDQDVSVAVPGRAPAVLANPVFLAGVVVADDGHHVTTDDRQGRPVGARARHLSRAVDVGVCAAGMLIGPGLSPGEKILVLDHHGGNRTATREPSLDGVLGLLQIVDGVLVWILGQ